MLAGSGDVRALAAVLVLSRGVWAVDQGSQQDLLVGAGAERWRAGLGPHEWLPWERCTVKVHAHDVREGVVVQAQQVPVATRSGLDPQANLCVACVRGTCSIYIHKTGFIFKPRPCLHHQQCPCRNRSSLECSSDQLHPWQGPEVGFAENSCMKSGEHRLNWHKPPRSTVTS